VLSLAGGLVLRVIPIVLDHNVAHLCLYSIICRITNLKSKTRFLQVVSLFGFQPSVLQRPTLTGLSLEKGPPRFDVDDIDVEVSTHLGNLEDGWL